MNTDLPNVTSKALVPYDPTLPHVRVHLQVATDNTFRKAIKIDETANIIPSIPLKDRRLSQILPPLTGPYTIGRSSLVVDIPESYSSKYGSNKKIGIEIFAPTSLKIGNKLPLEMHRGYRPGPGIALTEDQMKTLHTHALNLDRIDTVENMPIIIFSHGFAVGPNIYRPLIEELASHGFIVLNLNHPASSNHAPFSQEALDAHTFDQLFSNPKEGDEATEKMAFTQAANIKFVVELIRGVKLEKMPKNCGLKNKIILAGHSLGGATSVIATRDNPEIAGCINLDGRLEGPAEIRAKGLEVPILVLCSEPESQNEGELAMAENLNNLRKNTSPSLYTQKMIRGVRHMDFTIHPVLDWLVGGTDVNGGLKAHTIASQEILTFLKSIK